MVQILCCSRGKGLLLTTKPGKWLFLWATSRIIWIIRLGDSWRFTTMMASEKKDSVQASVKLADNSSAKGKRSTLDPNQQKRTSWECKSGRKFRKTDYGTESKSCWLKGTSGEHLIQPSTQSGTTVNTRSGQPRFYLVEPWKLQGQNFLRLSE